MAKENPEDPIENIMWPAKLQITVPSRSPHGNYTTWVVQAFESFTGPDGRNCHVQFTNNGNTVFTITRDPSVPLNENQIFAIKELQRHGFTFHELA